MAVQYVTHAYYHCAAVIHILYIHSFHACKDLRVGSEVSISISPVEKERASVSCSQAGPNLGSHCAVRTSAAASARTCSAMRADLAENATFELVSLLRDVRDTTVATDLERTRMKATNTLTDQLEDLVRVIKDSTEERARLHALSQIANALAYVAASNESGLLQRVERAGALKSICHWCCSDDHIDDDDLLKLGTALAIVSNVAYMGRTEIVVASGATALIYRLITSSSTPSAVNAYAVAALENLTADPYGAAAFTKSERDEMLIVLGEMTSTSDLVARAYCLGGIKNLKRLQVRRAAVVSCPLASLLCLECRFRALAMIVRHGSEIGGVGS